jgi:radical SAM superfamily enzyme YgiQ (UPF0313 family)
MNSLKILFVVYDNDSYISHFPVGIAYLASAVREAGYEVKIYNQDVYHYEDSHLTEYLNENSFDVIGMGACGGYYQYKKIKSLCKAIKKSKNSSFVVLGGHLVSPDPEFFLRTFDCNAICIGEGEITFVDLLNALANNNTLRKVNGLAYLENGTFVKTEDRPLITDVDSINMPAYDLFPIDHYALLKITKAQRNERAIPMLSGRGCTFKCNFCYRMDKGFRPRTANSILKEIKYLMDNYNIKCFIFDDELLMNSIKRATELCQEFIKSGLNFRWTCNGRLNYAIPDILNLMKEAGCIFINYGIESVNDFALRNMNKSLNVKQIIAGIEATLNANINPGFNIIFGNIGENMECLKNDVNFLLKYDDYSQLRTIRPVTPYPGSPLFDYAVKKGFIKNIEDFYENKHKNSDLLTVNFTEMTDDEFYEGLFQANKILLENYFKHIEFGNMKTLTDLYKNLNSNFRGFRHT